jgi:hypothetical protein
LIIIMLAAATREEEEEEEERRRRGEGFVETIPIDARARAAIGDDAAREDDDGAANFIISDGLLERGERGRARERRFRACCCSGSGFVGATARVMASEGRAGAGLRARGRACCVCTFHSSEAGV